MENILRAEKFISEEWILEKYDLYKNMLFQIAFSYLGNKYDCEDVIQEAFIKLCYHSPEFDNNEHEKRWLIRVTINLCINNLRSFWNRKKVSIDGLEEYFSSDEEIGIMSDIINLPEKYKTVILLHYISGYRISEISEIMNLSESAVKMRLKRGREKLKIELEGLI
ncbi:MAG: RNA polymerase sigma factor [Clostridiales bacterium]|jgi:RNA polymerase sigma-70 factor (ECF subfamily)|nr:RNA polymerase sigma factor [Clostridiales bacterium]